MHSPSAEFSNEKSSRMRVARLAVRKPGSTVATMIRTPVARTGVLF